MLYLMARGRPSLRQTRKRFTPDWGNEGECERLPEEGKDPLSSQSRKKKKEKKTPHIILSSWQVGQTTMVGIDKIQKINVSLQLICLQRLDRWCKWGSTNGCRRLRSDGLWRPRVKWPTWRDGCSPGPADHCPAAARSQWCQTFWFFKSKLCYKLLIDSAV